MSLPRRKKATVLVVLVVVLLVAIPLLWYRFLVLGPPLPKRADGSVDSAKLVNRYSKLLDPTRRPVARISLRDHEGDEDPLSSKILGNYYLPKGQEPPKDVNDRPMLLLAQINFAEMPPMEPYPTEGILQFFISAHDDLLGCDWEGFEVGEEVAYGNYEVRYHPVIDKDPGERVTDFSFLPDMAANDVFSPYTKPAAIQFSSADTERRSFADFRTHDVLDHAFFERFRRGEDDAYEAFWEELRGSGHKIGGYPDFAQDDPRWPYSGKRKKELELLFQLDSEDPWGMWGDAGIGNFFITPEDLKNRDFSQVIYNWDCS